MMPDAETKPEQCPLEDAAALIESLFNGDARSHPTIEQLLKWIARRMGAFASALWERAEGADIQANPPQGDYYFTAAAWVDAKDFFAMHDAPITGTTVGGVFVNQQPRRLDDIPTQGGIRRDHPFFVRHDLTRVLVVPVPGGQWCLALYRQRQQVPGPFTEDDTVRLTQIAALLPGLYRAVMDRNRLRLHHDITEIIRKSVPLKGSDAAPTEQGQKSSAASRAEMEAMMGKICESVLELFHCLEVSIFLEDPRRGVKLFENVASTWPEILTNKSYAVADADRCMTGWVLKNRESLRITDLLRFHPDFPEDFQRIKGKYPGLAWSNHEHLKKQMLEKLAIKSEPELPPASALSVPILHGDQLLGVLRCCLSKSAPLYFSKLEQESFELAAALIGQSWSAWLSQRETDDENLCWRQVVSSIRQLNGFVVEKLSKTPDEQEILEESLRVTAKVFPGVPFNSVRLADKDEKNLKIVAFLAVKSWPEKKQKDFADKLKALEMPITKDASVGANVFLTRKPYTIIDKSSPLYQRLYDDAGVRWLHFEPILVGDQCYGVLDVRGSGPDDREPFIPDHFYPVMELMARQIGLYHSLALMKQKEDRLLARQKSVYEDLAHQLKGPVAFANRWARQSLVSLGWKTGRSTYRGGDSPEGERAKKLFTSLLAVRGLCRKAKRVTSSLGILAADEDHTPLTPDLKQGEYGRLVRLLVEAAQDMERMVDPTRNMSFVVKRQTLSPDEIERVKFDYDLTEQAVGNLLDNAAKYGFSDSMVNVFASVNSAETEFVLCVTNRGLKMNAEDVNRCREKHYRSKEAQEHTGEGVGVGLYIVHKIMQAHRGRLDIDPCNPDGLTEFRLVFPI